MQGTGQRHALKVLREPTLAAQTELLREAETLVQLSHPKIVKFFRQDVQVNGNVDSHQVIKPMQRHSLKK